MNYYVTEAETMSDKRPIGVFDSGLGGLTVVKELTRVMPDERIVYFGDTSRVPYGNKSRSTIKKYAAQDERFLLSHDVKMIIAACGTVSSVATDTADDLPVPFVEVVSHASKAALDASRNKRIGIIGTSATIKSGAHKRVILSLCPEAAVFENSCPLFVPLVEEGVTAKGDVVATEVARRYLEPLIDAKVDTLILGCTHYPVLGEVIADIMGDGVTLINMGEATAAFAKDYLEKHGMLCDRRDGENEFFVSDKSDSFSETARVLLGDGNIEAVQVDIEKI